jgi:hypothetical protein
MLEMLLCPARTNIAISMQKLALKYNMQEKICFPTHFRDSSNEKGIKVPVNKTTSYTMKRQVSPNG